MDFIFELFLQIFAEVLLKGPGYLILRWLKPNEKHDPDGCFAFILGVSFWSIVDLVVWALW